VTAGRTANPAARFLSNKGNNWVIDLAASIWGILSERLTKNSSTSCRGGCDYVEYHLELRTSTTDMWTCGSCEDVDDWDEEEEDW
jgi:hypothetical protein